MSLPPPVDTAEPPAAAAEVARGAGTLAVTRLMLTDFRCYEAARLETDRRPVVLTGRNGAGKTNLLEALSFLAPGRGLRRAGLGEITRREAGPGARWSVAARLATPAAAGGTVAIGTGLDPNSAPGSPRRIVRIDGETMPSQTRLGAQVAFVWLTPQMDRLFQEGAAGRRRFLDRLVYGFEGAHAGHAAAYEQAMRERARLLRDEREGGRRADPAWLEALEEQMAGNGVAVAAARRALVLRLDGVAAETVGAGPAAAEPPFPPAAIDVRGTVEHWLADRPALAAEDAFRALLRRSRRADAVMGGAADGPHRSDLEVRHAAKDLPADQCSTGEQKALLIGLVLANARLLAAERGAPPVLLLDEVAAHLDAGRRAALFDALAGLGARAWLTGTDADLFAAFGERARHVRVENARLREISPGMTI